VSRTYWAFRSLSLRHIFSGHSKYSSNQPKYIRAHISRILYWWCLTGIWAEISFLWKTLCTYAGWLTRNTSGEFRDCATWMEPFLQQSAEHCEPMQLLVKMSGVTRLYNVQGIILNALHNSWNKLWVQNGNISDYLTGELQQLC